MKCPRCQRENPSKMKFWPEYGAHFALTCVQFGTDLPADARYFMGFGARFVLAFPGCSYAYLFRNRPVDMRVPIIFFCPSL